MLYKQVTKYNLTNSLISKVLILHNFSPCVSPYNGPPLLGAHKSHLRPVMCVTFPPVSSGTHCFRICFLHQGVLSLPRPRLFRVVRQNSEPQHCSFDFKWSLYFRFFFMFYFCWEHNLHTSFSKNILLLKRSFFYLRFHWQSIARDSSDEAKDLCYKASKMYRKANLLSCLSLYSTYFCKICSCVIVTYVLINNMGITDEILWHMTLLWSIFSNHGVTPTCKKYNSLGSDVCTCYILKLSTLMRNLMCPWVSWRALINQMY